MEFPLFEPEAANWESAASVHRRGKLWQRWDVSGSGAARLASSPCAGGQITHPPRHKGVSCQPDNHLTLHSLPPRLAVTQAARGEGAERARSARSAADPQVAAHAVYFSNLFLFLIITIRGALMR